MGRLYKAWSDHLERRVLLYVLHGHRRDRAGSSEFFSWAREASRQYPGFIDVGWKADMMYARLVYPEDLDAIMMLLRLTGPHHEPQD
jgi:hypothetical protein